MHSLGKRAEVLSLSGVRISPSPNFKARYKRGLFLFLRHTLVVNTLVVLSLSKDSPSEGVPSGF
jgi:hypothetical protein